MEGYYNADDGTFEIRTCDLDTDFDHPTYGPVDMWFVGVIDHNGKQVFIKPAQGYYVISTQTLSSDGNSATCRTGTVSVSNIGTKELVSMQFAGYVSAGALSSIGDTILFPMTMTKVPATGTSTELISTGCKYVCIKHRNFMSESGLKSASAYSAE